MNLDRFFADSSSRNQAHAQISFSCFIDQYRIG
jgi:hypothetical protein